MIQFIIVIAAILMIYAIYEYQTSISSSKSLNWKNSISNKWSALTGRIKTLNFAKILKNITMVLGSILMVYLIALCTIWLWQLINPPKQHHVLETKHEIVRGPWQNTPDTSTQAAGMIKPVTYIEIGKQYSFTETAHHALVRNRYTPRFHFTPTRAGTYHLTFKSADGKLERVVRFVRKNDNTMTFEFIKDNIGNRDEGELLLIADSRVPFKVTDVDDIPTSQIVTAH